MYTLHTHCRACGFAAPGANGTKSAPTDRLVEVLDLGVQPLANDFRSQSEEHAGFAPLKLMVCPRCSLGQLSVVVRPDILYSNYSYITGTSEMMRHHFEALWNDIRSDAPTVKNVLEIGSNTGDFLAHIKEHGAQVVLGVDPAENLCEIARKRLVPTSCALFTEEWTNQCSVLSNWDCVVARHVFCHIDDWHDFIRALTKIGHAETLYVIEVPYVVNTIEKNSWDQIYHEHLSYLSLKAMDALLCGSGLHIHSVCSYPIHGGAIAIMLRRDESAVRPCTRPIDNLTLPDWKQFASNARTAINSLDVMVQSLVNAGKTVVGFGASAKSTVWINAVGFRRKHIRFICDSTPQKQWKFSPGSDIPIVDEGALLREMPDYAVCFAWNFMPDILKSQALYIEKGGKFIVPVPNAHIVP